MTAGADAKQYRGPVLVLWIEPSFPVGLRSPITTHMLDTSMGKPAAGVRISLQRLRTDCIGKQTVDLGSAATRVIAWSVISSSPGFGGENWINRVHFMCRGSYAISSSLAACRSMALQTTVHLQSVIGNMTALISRVNTLIPSIPVLRLVLELRSYIIW